MSGGDASPRDRAARVGFPWIAPFRRRPRPSTAEACEAIEARARVLEHVRNIAVPSVANGDPAPLLLRTHPGNITQVVMQPDRCALSVQIRHWRHETIGPVTVKETDDT